MRLSVLKLAPVVVVFGLAACGSSSTTTPSAAATDSSSPSASASGAANAVCAQFNTQINAISPTPPADPQTVAAASDLTPIATWMDAVLPLATQEETALNAAADSGPVKAEFTSLVNTFQAADTAAKGGDPSAFKSQWANFRAAQNAFFAAATAANMPDCAK